MFRTTNVWSLKDTGVQYLIIAFVVVAGMGMPVQDALNAQLRGAVKSPMLGALISFLIGSLALLGLTLARAFGRGELSGLAKSPWYVWLGGGLIGAAGVTAGLIALPKVSAGVTIAATVFGELLAAVVIDHFGWLDVPQVRLNAWRIAGAVLLFIGALMMQHKG